MPAAHIYIFSDASPTDWLVPGRDDDWHTIANFVFQCELKDLTNGFGDATHETILANNSSYAAFIDSLARGLPSAQLKKWKTGPGYKARFCKAIENLPAEQRPCVSGLSFQERVLRQSETSVLYAYNQRIGGVEGRGIGFQEYSDRQGRRCLRHEYINFFGRHVISGPDSQLLVLLLTAWRIADQYLVYHRALVQSGRFGFDDLLCTVVSDKLSGDDDLRTKSETALRNLVNPDRNDTPIRIVRSARSDNFSGDLIVDNLAGWLNAALREPAGDLAASVNGLASSGLLADWHYLLPSADDICLGSALEAIGAG